MYLPPAEQLIARANKGEKLMSVERRSAVAYLQSTQPELSNVEVARMFGVSEKQIRLDKEQVRKELAKVLSSDDCAMVIVDIKLNFDRQLRDLERGKAKAKIGTDTYLRYCKAIFEIEERRVRLLQDLGYYPKNLGTQTVEHYEFQAIVHKSTGKVETLDKRLIREPEPVDAEFTDLPALPAPADLDSSDSMQTVQRDGTA